MKSTHLLVVPALLAAMLALTGCGAGDLKLGQSAVVDVVGAGKPEHTYEVTVKSLTEAPAEVVAKYDTEDKMYFAVIEAKLADPSKATGDPIGVTSNVASKLSDGNYLRTIGSGPDECPGRVDSPTQNSADLKAGKTLTICVALSSDGDKDVVGVYVGPSTVNDGKGKVWARS